MAGIRFESAVISTGVAILAVVVLVCGGLIAVPLGTVLVQDWQFQVISNQCSILKDVSARQACYDNLRVEQSRHSAKGANAPVLLLSLEQQRRAVP